MNEKHRMSIYNNLNIKGMGENQATFGCILNGVGELVSHIRLEHLRDQKSMGYMGDLKQLESFILEHRPDAVAVGTADFNSRLLFKELETIVSSTTNDKVSKLRNLIE